VPVATGTQTTPNVLQTTAAIYTAVAAAGAALHASETSAARHHGISPTVMSDAWPAKGQSRYIGSAETAGLHTDGPIVTQPKPAPVSVQQSKVNPSVAMVFLNVRCNCGAGVNDPRCISGSVPPRDKISKAIPMFSRISFSTVPMLTLPGDSFTPKFKMAPENRK